MVARRPRTFVSWSVQQEDVDVVGVEGRERAVDRLDQVLVREVEVRSARHDPGLGLDDQLGAVGGRQLQGLGEPALAAVQRGAVDVGVVEERDPGVTRCGHQGADLVVGLVLDAHEAEHDVRHDHVGARQSEGLHGVVVLSVV